MIPALGILDGAYVAEALPTVAVLLGIWRELRVGRHETATEARVVRAYLMSIGKAVGAPPPTFPAPPPPSFPDAAEHRPMNRSGFPRALGALFLALALLPTLAGCVSTRDGGLAVEPMASAGELEAVKEYAADEVGTVRRELEAADARLRADFDARAEAVRRDLEGAMAAGSAAFRAELTAGAAPVTAELARVAAVAGEARASAEAARTDAVEANSRSADAYNRATESAAERRQALEDVLTKAKEGRWSWEELLAALGLTGVGTGVAVNRYRNATRAAALAAVGAAGGAAGAPAPAPRPTA